MALAGMSAGGRGVDTTDTAAGGRCRRRLWRGRSITIVAVTGEVDYVTDGQRTRAVTGGDRLMTGSWGPAVRFRRWWRPVPPCTAIASKTSLPPAADAGGGGAAAHGREAGSFTRHFLMRCGRTTDETN